MRRVDLRVCAAAAVLAACAAPGPAPAPSSPTPAVLAPVADHHQHLTSPAVAALVDGPPMLPAVTLPAELQQLLQSREQRWNDATGLAELFADDATTLGRNRRGWIHGRAAVVTALGSTFARPYRMTPTHLRADGSRAEVSGYYSRLDGSHVGYFHLAARRGADGRWRIQDEIPRFPVEPAKPVVDGAELVRRLDAAGVRRALVLSEGFWFDGPLLKVDDPYPKVVAENDWTAAQAAAFPDRLIAFCSFNPVADHALQELERCARSGGFRGLKFSFAMSGVDLKNPEHLARVERVFAAAERHKLPIVLHLRGAGGYDGEHVTLFLDRLMARAPGIPVQVAHLWGGEAYPEAALAALAEAIQARRPGTQNLWFDVAELWLQESPDVLETSAERIRQIGLNRVLFGSDTRVAPAEAWKLFRQRVPLTDAEFARIAANVPPYAR